nr:hypothetical protein B7F18.50 [imported] - Neurospora crassa [Neurospora crassa]
MSILQIPYREGRDGFWGEQTSTLNWCEEDYNITYYCAELVNTLTNLMFMWLGVKGLRNVLEFKHSPIFILAYVGYLVVGLGSMAFHATLKSTHDLYRLYHVLCHIFLQEIPEDPITDCLDHGWAWYLHHCKQVMISFGRSLGREILPRAAGLCARCGRWHWFVSDARPFVPNEDYTDTWNIIAIITFVGGFFIWNMDNIFCRHLTTAKNQLQLPWSIVLEGHGWWHILTGLGAARRRNSCLIGGLGGLFLRSFPEPTRVQPRAANNIRQEGERP